MAIGDDGQEHLAIMRALADPDAQVPENRTVPAGRAGEGLDVVFGLFPLMYDDGMEWPWFETTREVLDAMEQVTECFVYLHQRLIAHRDFSVLEVFTNYGRGYSAEPKDRFCARIPLPFRSLCPDLRCLINDFELLVQFAPDSDPRTRLVTGIPVSRYGGAAETYCKALPPQALLDAPYCPFKTDM